MTARFRVSTEVVDLTPPVGFPLGGYISRTGVSEGVRDPIYARLFLIGDNRDALLVISLDWLFIDGRWAKEVKKRTGEILDIDEDRVIVTAVHTHSGPGIFGSSFRDVPGEASYLSEATDLLTEAAGRIGTDTAEATLFLGNTTITGLGAHRNDPEHVIDNNLSVLSFEKKEGTGRHRIIVYGCHPTVLGPKNLLFSADWTGAGISAVDRTLGGTSIFVNGAAGDVSTRFTRRGRDNDEIDRCAAIFRDAVKHAQAGETTLAAGPIVIRTLRVPVRYKDLPDRRDAERELMESERAIAAARAANDPPGKIRRLEAVREGVFVSLLFASSGGFEAIFGKREMTTAVTLARIGPLGMIFLPGEVMSETAARLRAAAKRPLMVCGYSNDYFGYFTLEEGVYESSAAVLSPDSIRRIIDAAVRLIEEDA